MRPEKLHPYSRGFYEFLLREEPTWLQHAWNVLGYNHKMFDIEIEIPHPRAGRKVGKYRREPEPICIWMNYGEELSLSCGAWHGHPRGMASESVPQLDYEAGVETIRAIMAEREVRVTAIGPDGHIAGDVVGPQEVDDCVRSMLLEHEVRPLRIEAWSWLGSYDRRIVRR